MGGCGFFRSSASLDTRPPSCSSCLRHQEVAGFRAYGFKVDPEPETVSGLGPQTLNPQTPTVGTLKGSYDSYRVLGSSFWGWAGVC